MTADPKRMIEDNLACLESDAKRLLAWMANERRLTEPVRLDYREVLEGMQRDIDRLRILLAIQERAMPHYDSDDLAMLP